MRETAQSIRHGLGDTWKGQDVACPALLQSGTVLTLPVKQIGTPRDLETTGNVTYAAQPARIDLGSTLRFGSLQRAQAERPFVTAELRRAMALAQTIPALTPEELGLSSSDIRAIAEVRWGDSEVEASGVRALQSRTYEEIEPLALWLDHRDRGAIAAPSGTTVMHQWPAPLVLCATAMLCVLSALAFSWLGN